MDAFAWLDTFLEEKAEEEIDEETAETNAAIAEFADVFGEAFDASGLKDKLSRAGKKVSQLIDKIIATIREMAEKFKLKYAQIHFQASLKKLGKNCAKQIQAAGVPKEHLAAVKSALAIGQKSTKQIYALWMKAESGKITFDQYNSQLEIVMRNNAAAANAIELKVDSVISSLSDKVLYKTSDILGQYDKAVESLLSAQAASTKYTVDQLGKLKKNKVNSAQAESISNKAARVIQSIHTLITKIINKIASSVTSLGDKALRRASSGSGKDNVKNEEFDESMGSDLDAFLENFDIDAIGEDGVDIDTFLEGYGELSTDEYFVEGTNSNANAIMKVAKMKYKSAMKKIKAAKSQGNWKAAKDGCDEAIAAIDSAKKEIKALPATVGSAVLGMIISDLESWAKATLGCGLYASVGIAAGANPTAVESATMKVANLLGCIKTIKGVVRAIHAVKDNNGQITVAQFNTHINKIISILDKMKKEVQGLSQVCSANMRLMKEEYEGEDFDLDSFIEGSEEGYSEEEDFDLDQFMEENYDEDAYDISDFDLDAFLEEAEADDEDFDLDEFLENYEETDVDYAEGEDFDLDSFIEGYEGEEFEIGAEDEYSAYMESLDEFIQEIMDD